MVKFILLNLLSNDQEGFKDIASELTAATARSIFLSEVTLFCLWHFQQIERNAGIMSNHLCMMQNKQVALGDLQQLNNLTLSTLRGQLLQPQELSLSGELKLLDFETRNQRTCGSQWLLMDGEAGET